MAVFVLHSHKLPARSVGGTDCVADEPAHADQVAADSFLVSANALDKGPNTGPGDFEALRIDDPCSSGQRIYKGRSRSLIAEANR
jgi:hypothetical protein